MSKNVRRNGGIQCRHFSVGIPVAILGGILWEFPEIFGRISGETFGRFSGKFLWKFLEPSLPEFLEDLGWIFAVISEEILGNSYRSLRRNFWRKPLRVFLKIFVETRGKIAPDFYWRLKKIWRNSRRNLKK